jgi:septal ring factor EnvC (AmiA/AmiB activator)
MQRSEMRGLAPRRAAPLAALLLFALTAAATPPDKPKHHASHATKTGKPAPAAQDAAKRQQAASALKQAEAARAQKLATAAQASREQLQAAARAAALAQQRVEAADKLRAIESRVDTAAQSVADAEAAQKAAEEQVQDRAADLTALLPVALRLSQYPSETLLAAPVPPEKALEGLLATKGLSAELARQVQDLRDQERAAADLKAATAKRQAALAAERARQAQAAQTLDRQLGAAKTEAQSAQDEAGEAAEAAAVLAAKADDLKSAIAAMDQAERDAAAQAAQDAANLGKQRKQQLADAARAREAVLARPAGPGLSGALPKATLVAGRLVRAFGAPSDDGPATGVTFSAAPAAFVSSPCLGRVGFAAPFRSYGKLMIIECGGGYDFVLAGLDRLDVPVGRPVRAGEPLGRMADYDPAKSTDRPGLYVELRKNGQAINPLPYLNGKG